MFSWIVVVFWDLPCCGFTFIAALVLLLPVKQQI